MARTTANKKGSKTRIWTEQEKDIIKALAIARTPHAAIAKAVGTDKETLLKHFGEFLEVEKLRFDAFVVGQVAKAIKQGDKSMIMFYCKTQMGWRETSNLELSGNVAIKVNIDAGSKS
jgi:hypothetical protein